MSKFDDILNAPPIPDPPEPKRLRAGDPHPPPDILAKLREFIQCRRGLTWDALQQAITGRFQELIPGDHTLSVNKAWSQPSAPEHFSGRRRPGSWQGGPFIVDTHIALGRSSLQFCKAIKTLLDEGQLQILVDGSLQHAIDPVTDYGYQNPDAPKLPGLHVTITPGE